MKVCLLKKETQAIDVRAAFRSAILSVHAMDDLALLAENAGKRTPQERQASERRGRPRTWAAHYSIRVDVFQQLYRRMKCAHRASLESQRTRTRAKVGAETSLSAIAVSRHNGTASDTRGRPWGGRLFRHRNPFARNYVIQYSLGATCQWC